MSGLDELLSETDVTPTPEAETPPAEVVTPEPQADPQEPAQSEAATPQAPPVQHVPHTVPLAAQLDERDRRKAAEAKAAALEQKLAAIERAKAEAAAQRPNVLDDPDAYDAWWDNRIKTLEQGFQQRLQQTIVRERIESSMEKWTDKLGEQKFAELHAWSATMPPQWVRWAESQRDPFGVAYKEFEKQQKAKRADELAAKLGDKDLDAWLEERLAERLAQQQPTQEASQAARPADTRQRNADGTFAPTPEPQRHRPKSLADLNGAAIAAQSAPGHALDGLISD